MSTAIDDIFPEEDYPSPQPSTTASPAHSRQSSGASPSTYKKTYRDYLRIPAPVRALFDRFPLHTYPPNALPARSPRISNQHTLYVFTTPADAAAGRPSFNPTCLKWQAYLAFHSIPVKTVPSNNHASPSGSLPFLLTASPSRSSSLSAVGSSAPTTIAASRLPSWIGSRASHGPELEAAEPACLKLLYSLLNHNVRTAYLWALYEDPDAFDNVIAPLYVHTATSNPLVRDALSWPLRKAAFEEVLNTVNAQGVMGGTPDAGRLLEDAEVAFTSLSTMLGDARWFVEGVRPEELGGEEKSGKGPSMLDAAVFAYTHVILEYIKAVEPKSSAGQLISMVKKHENLVNHRNRILKEFF